MKLKIAVMGVGHLGSAMTRGIMRAGVPADNLTLIERTELTGDIQSKFGVRVVDSIEKAVGWFEYIFLAVKAAQFEDIAATVPVGLWKDKTIISCMAGVPIERIRELVGLDPEIVRIMPSLTVENREGIIGYTHCAPELARLFEKLGYAFEVLPDDIEKVTAFSGCGPGFAAYILDAFSKAGVMLGFSEKQADMIASKTFASVAERGGDYRTLANAVATPGGATEQGILKLDEGDLYGDILGAVKAAYIKVKPGDK